MVGQEIMGTAQESASRFSSLRPLKLLMVSIEGIPLETPPPLPIRVCPFHFLTKIDLMGVGLMVEEVPFNFGWKLKKFEIVESESEEFHIRDIGKNFGDENLSGLDFLLKIGVVEEGREETGAGTGLEACFLEPFETVTEALETSEKIVPERSGEEVPKKRRFKVPAGRTDLPFARPFKHARTHKTKETKKTSTSNTKKAKPSQSKSKAKSTEEFALSSPVKSTRKSLRLALPISAKKPRKGVSGKQVPEQVEDLVSSSEEDSATEAGNNPQEQVPSPVSEEHSFVPPPETIPETPQTKPSTKPALKSSPPKTATKRRSANKRKAKIITASESEKESSPEPASKKARKSTSSPPSASTAKFLQRTVVRGKIVKVTYFQKQGVEVFLDKLRAQGWLDLFTNTHLGCSGLELAEFYANCSITQGVVMSTVGGKKLRFNAEKLGEILGVPCLGFDTYVREDKEVLGTARLLELAQRLSGKTELETPRSVKKGDMTPLHQLLFWFIIKNVIPRGQRRNLADAMDQCLIDLMDREEPINLPALMIRHIKRIADTSREHDLGYGFLLTLVFEYFGVTLTKKVGVQFVDEIGGSTLLGCGYTLPAGTAQEQGLRTPCPTVSGSSTVGSTVDALAQAHVQLASEVATLKSAFDADRAETITRYEALLSLLRDLSAKLPPPPSAS